MQSPRARWNWPGHVLRSSLLISINVDQKKKKKKKKVTIQDGGNNRSHMSWTDGDLDSAVLQNCTDGRSSKVVHVLNAQLAAKLQRINLLPVCVWSGKQHGPGKTWWRWLTVVDGKRHCSINTRHRFYNRDKNNIDILLSPNGRSMKPYPAVSKAFQCDGTRHSGLFLSVRNCQYCALNNKDHQWGFDREEKPKKKAGENQSPHPFSGKSGLWWGTLELQPGQRRADVQLCRTLKKGRASISAEALG